MSTPKSTAPPKPRRKASKPFPTLACVRIGFEHYVMPADKALKVVELMQSAFTCQPEFMRSGQRYTTTAKEQPELQLEILQAGQLKHPLDVAPAFHELFAWEP